MNPTIVYMNPTIVYMNPTIVSTVVPEMQGAEFGFTCQDAGGF